MANRFAVATGNWSATSTWDGGTLPTTADDVFANAFTVTINQNVNVLSVRTTSASGISAGGGFTVSASGFTLQADIYAGTTACVTSTVTSGGTFTVTTQTGVCLGGSASTAYAVNNNGTGTVNITGNPTGGTTTEGLRNSTTGTVNITGNPTGGSVAAIAGVLNVSTGTINITGNPTGGSALSTNGVSNFAAGTINITGNPTGGTGSSSFGAVNSSTGIMVITGSATASSAASGAQNASSGILRVTNAIGNGFGLGSVGITNVTAVVSSSNNSLTYVQQLTFGSLGATPVSGPIILTDLTTNSVRFYREGGGTKTLVDQAATAGVLPAVGDVRSGTVYAAGNRTGTCAVPSAGSVALGVPVDATTGTAVLTAANVRTAVGMASANLDTQLDALPTAAEIAQAIWQYTTRTLSDVSAIVSGVWSATTRTVTGGSIDSVANLDAPTEAEIAAAVRNELATELGRIDVATSTRLAPSGTLARVTLTDTTTAVTDTAGIAEAVRTELTPELARVANTATTQEVADIVEGAIGS